MIQHYRTQFSTRASKTRLAAGLIAILLPAAFAWLVWPSRALGQQGGRAKTAFQTTLPNVPGKSLTAVEVDYPLGGKSQPHHHAGSVFVYVLSGKIRSQSSLTGPVKVYAQGEAFFEPPGSEHLISENASATEPAKLLAVFVADDGATLTTPSH